MRFILIAALLAAFTLIGCSKSRTSVETPRSADTGLIVGARWWQYYERGLGHLEAERYDAAVEDFQKALQARPSDVHRARTYGMHFIAYYANRELGAALIELGDEAGAEEALRRSMEAAPTDRAETLLDAIASVETLDG